MAIIHLNIGSDYKASVFMIEGNLFNVEIYNVKSAKKYVIENMFLDTLPKDVESLITYFRSKIENEIKLINGVMTYVN